MTQERDLHMSLKSYVSLGVAVLALGALALSSGPAAAQGIRPPTFPTKKAPVATKAPPRPRTTAVPRVSAAVDLRFDRMGYDWWGRPAQMDNPEAQCGNLDDSRRTLRLEAAFQIVNKSRQPLAPGDYWVQFYKTDGKVALTCFWLYEGASGMPTINAQQTANITFMAFVEPNERVAYAQLITKPFGRGPRVNVPKNLNVP
jgi:hypothetical protein